VSFSLRSRGLIYPKFFLDREAGVINRKLFQKKFDQKRRNRDGVVNRKPFEKRFDRKSQSSGVMLEQLIFQFLGQY
jgi:hypothetical protein